MKKKETLDSIVSAFRLINAAKISRMEDEEKFALIKTARTLKKVNTDFEDLLKIAQEKLKTDEVDEIIRKIRSNEGVTNDEKRILDKFNTGIQACMKSELVKEIEIEIDPLSEKAIKNFIASNDFSVNEVMLVYDIIGC